MCENEGDTGECRLTVSWVPFLPLSYFPWRDFPEFNFEWLASHTKWVCFRDVLSVDSQFPGFLFNPVSPISSASTKSFDFRPCGNSGSTGVDLGSDSQVVIVDQTYSRSGCSMCQEFGPVPTWCRAGFFPGDEQRRSTTGMGLPVSSSTA